MWCKKELRRGCLGLWHRMYKQVEKELSEIKKPEEDRLKKAYERIDVDRDGACPSPPPPPHPCTRPFKPCIPSIIGALPRIFHRDLK